MIFSQPDQYGVAPRLDVIHNYWTAFLEQRGRTTRETGKTVTAYVSENRWVADCPECGGGIACWELNPYGCCLTCGAIYKVTYPKDHEAAAEILEARPPANRHWFPHRGETLQHLEAENVVRLNPVDELVVPSVAKIPTPDLTAADRKKLADGKPVLGTRCPNCNRLGVNATDTAKKPCPNCAYSPQDAAFIVDEKCPGWELCVRPIFHHRPSGLHFWCFDGFVAPGVPRAD